MEQAMDNEIVNMINVSENDAEDTPVVEANDIPVPSVATDDPAEAVQAEATPEGNTETSEDSSEDNVLNENDCVTVSEIILQNVDKHIKMTLLNDLVHANSANADVTNYIVYVNTDKNIPCIYDCQKLIVPKTSVKTTDGNWNITSIEGRRSGFVIKCPGRDLVMSKNFIYDITFDADGKISAICEYNRKHSINNVTFPPPASMDYDMVSFLISSVLPKIVKCGKYKTIPELQEQVKNSYNAVDDINAMFKIADLRMKINC